jgi:hypothetical protein
LERISLRIPISFSVVYLGILSRSVEQEPMKTNSIHHFDPDSTLQDCSCGWKTSPKRRRTLTGAHNAWQEHVLLVEAGKRIAKIVARHVDRRP